VQKGEDRLLKERAKNCINRERSSCIPSRLYTVGDDKAKIITHS
jgi:hypothetical protein